MSANPLLDFTGLPRFDEIRPEHITPAMDHWLADCQALVERLAEETAPPTWETFVAPLDEGLEKIGRAWGPISHLNAVLNSPALREAYNANLPRITTFFAGLSQDERLYRRYKELAVSPEFTRLNAAARRLVENELRDFRLGGAELPADKKARLMALQEEQAALAARFEENVLDTMNAWAHYVETADALSGIPEDAVSAAREAAQAEGKEGWKFTLHAPSWMPVMQYADNRQLRETLYRGYVTRASEFGQPQWDNTQVIRDILRLRQEEAALLGFAHYGDLSLATKMADSAEEVFAFLKDLAARARPSAERDLTELQAFARAELDLPVLEAWDMAWVSEKLRVHRYAFSDQEVKQYFPEDAVIQGLFHLVSTLYGLTIAPTPAPVWHPDVRFYSIYDADRNLIGQFYFDLYARPNKRGGAWMDDAIGRVERNGRVQTPVAYLTCNFTAPQAGKAALFTHDEVMTLFHEFGHGLHHLLTRVGVRGVSGINGVEWDAVELPSQFMENFCWEYDVLVNMTRHVDSGEPLPRPLYERMLAARNFQAGMQTLRQIEFSLFDMHLHTTFDATTDVPVLAVLEAVREEVAILRPPAYNRFSNSFSHIFAGGYAAGYYSYKWAEVLSADAYSLFEENGVLDPQTGSRFRDEILAMGGARPALESFIAFRGRKPAIDALLRHNGMAA